MAGWGYTKEDGPDTWYEVAPAGKGKRQSPIDIITSKAEFDEGLASKPLKWSYTPENAQTITNNSHSVQVTYNSDGSNLEGGPLQNKYKLAQFHLHWGKSDDSGSEHRVNGEMYASELHLVHWNSDLFPSFGEAAQKNNGLCVLGVFLKIGSEHKGLKQMTDLLSSVQHGGDTEKLTEPIDPERLLPGNKKEYWTYPGSLTTPPLYESVTWVVFKEPIEVSEQQMESLRSLKQYKKGETLCNEFNGCIVENYRPPMELHGRSVLSTCD